LVPRRQNVLQLQLLCNRSLLSFIPCMPTHNSSRIHTIHRLHLHQTNRYLYLYSMVHHGRTTPTRHCKATAPALEATVPLPRHRCRSSRSTLNPYTNPIPLNRMPFTTHQSLKVKMESESFAASSSALIRCIPRKTAALTQFLRRALIYAIPTCPSTTTGSEFPSAADLESHMRTIHKPAEARK